jgi:hypothetical protein
LYLCCGLLYKFYGRLKLLLDLVEGLRRVFCRCSGLSSRDVESVAEAAKVGGVLRLQYERQCASNDVANDVCRQRLLASVAFDQRQHLAKESAEVGSMLVYWGWARSTVGATVSP